jgi:hypothetical protein
MTPRRFPPPWTVEEPPAYRVTIPKSSLPRVIAITFISGSDKLAASARDILERAISTFA